jgi:hypothetical protein
MTTLDVDVADAETVARPAARSADTRAAIRYLVCSGATAIAIIENVKGCSFTVGTKISARAAVVMWLREDEARPVMRKARKLAGKRPDLTKATSALTKAASDQRVTLTEHAVAMMRAGDAAARIEQFMESLKGTGRLREFNRMFKRRRMEAMLRGEGFMSFGTASLRLRRAVGAYLSGGRDIQTATLFADVFEKAVSQK